MSEKRSAFLAGAIFLTSLLLLLLPGDTRTTDDLPKQAGAAPKTRAQPTARAPEPVTLEPLFSPSPLPGPSPNPAAGSVPADDSGSLVPAGASLQRPRSQVGRILLSGGREMILVEPR